MLHQLDRPIIGRMDLDPPARAAFEVESVERWYARVPEGFTAVQGPSLEWLTPAPGWPYAECMLRLSGQAHAD